MNAFPTRHEIASIINRLKTGAVDRTYAAQWAFSIIDADDIRVTDQVAWKVIQSLGAVDLPSSDRDYLYGIDDLNDWLRLLES
ncbi:hypothetical protein H9V85_003025 [Salmonella enterica subsp. enterica serovar Louisiana]|uniref:Uncharacterized protein n=3 Tax=Salmonella enterica TaxID=28901 RepID=A0A743YGE9_SALER|nr:hypothetical protein [Salmonella enterica subsp. enterica serovar Louisiana]EBG2397042.1 hypothetical protein [Salmonella enterica subsp. enterica serovar Everleigh]EBS5460770.1 hypothetical protein [Salmonella enterica subsp. enterica serovar Enteritidis]EBY3151280.1 hypothetical protein [Salmonella enterica subsp. enterica serovar Teshie]ECA1252597.1 hypothetical protein [Salmonella enterica subsp. enterica serovar Chailey]ECA7543588.1 hypothetical protein [Salmonella enterica subsp. ente